MFITNFYENQFIQNLNRFNLNFFKILHTIATLNNTFFYYKILK